MSAADRIHVQRERERETLNPNFGPTEFVRHWQRRLGFANESILGLSDQNGELSLEVRGRENVPNAQSVLERLHRETHKYFRQPEPLPLRFSEPELTGRSRVRIEAICNNFSCPRLSVDQLFARILSASSGSSCLNTRAGVCSDVAVSVSNARDGALSESTTDRCRRVPCPADRF